MTRLIAMRLSTFEETANGSSVLKKGGEVVPGAGLEPARQKLDKGF
jgi:hypothetical protein